MAKAASERAEVMVGTLSAGLQAANGDMGESAATITQDVLDAAYDMGHSFPGGVPALAQRMGVSANTLNHKLNPSNDTHHLTVRELQKAMHITGDHGPLHALCASLNHVALPISTNAGGCVDHALRELGAQVGDVYRQVDGALKDRRVTPNERKRIRREVAEAIAALNNVLQVL
ncbi:phage regulatory CII family protein [Eleftheria terrae]|uniref:phage regulatory CII family protein n=1 Tax=Eleftheria terrae TaxID=1597781 RepID=UPI00263B0239|nr:phage regulatory CII family protein [Eleftheria terrae]WKB52295.1 phage regulatory CII family protein [Eleftheria terrae]